MAGMMGRSSQQETDAVVWQTGAVSLGTTGLDLRTPIDPEALADLLNARFQDARTVMQRDGHTAVQIYDGSDIALAGPGIHTTGDWVFGHGAVISG